MKVLNLYAGIGGNRKLWKDVEVTAVEIDPEIAKRYKKYYPHDRVLIGDAHKYLIKHFQEFDFIWSSPPCPTHSWIRAAAVQRGQCCHKYPDMALYEEIIFLQTFAECPWVVENVISYYDPLIRPYEVGRHYFWSNFYIPNFKGVVPERIHNNIHGSKEVYGFKIKDSGIGDKRKVLRNLVDPHLGLHVFRSAFKEVQESLKEYS